MEANCRSFPPVASPGCRVLVLGSMPGVASLLAQQYYAHPRNAFWPILYALWDAGAPDAAYEARVAFALERGIAIWDVAQSCHREGSLDSSVRDVVPNDLRGFFAGHPGIRAVFFNGRLAESLFLRHFGEDGPKRRTLLPSTSPAYTLPLERKLAAWQAVRAALDQGQPFDHLAGG